jgi:hypothetical protein
MNDQDIARFLAAARVIDDRILINDLSVGAWSALLPEWMTLDLALEALKDHYRASDRKVMPANIINHARLRRPAIPPPPKIKCDDCAGTGWQTDIGEDGYRFAMYCSCEAGQRLKKGHGR